MLSYKSIKNTAILILNFLLLSVLYFPTQAQKKQESKSPKLYVSAPSGLSLRKAPRLSGERLGIIPYKENVLKLGEKKPLMHIDCKLGHWIKVSYKGVKGYVFGADLKEIEVLTANLN